MKEYIIIHGRNPNDVEIQVNTKIKDGWECLGGLEVSCVADGGIRAVFAQAMIREKQEEKSELSDEKLREMMRDPKYWRDQDPQYVRMIENGFKKLYGGK